jgi:hypothetical protein
MLILAVLCMSVSAALTHKSGFAIVFQFGLTIFGMLLGIPSIISSVSMVVTVMNLNLKEEMEGLPHVSQNLVH